jgi:hypothetical protein
VAIGKTSTLIFRIKLAPKVAMRMAADREHRSIATMVEVLIRAYRQRNDVTMSH